MGSKRRKMMKIRMLMTDRSCSCMYYCIVYIMYVCYTHLILVSRPSIGAIQHKQPAGAQHACEYAH